MTLSGIGRRILAAIGIRRDAPAPQASFPDMDAAYTPPAAAPATAVPDEPDEAVVDGAPLSHAVADFVAEVRHLPLFSGTATQLIRSVGDEGISSRELSRMIATDASLVAHLLRIVNSPYYGLPQRVATVADALSVLGFDQTRRMITAAVLQRPLMTYLHDTTLVHEFWRHELLCAALARHLALHRGCDGELAYMAGLMHDVGRLAMLVQYPQHTDALLGVDAEDARSGTDREFARFGFDHAEVGGALLDLWGLPRGIVQATFLHADDTQPAEPIASCVWLANQLAHRMAEAVDDDGEQPWMTEIGLTVDDRRRIVAEIRALEGEQG